MAIGQEQRYRPSSSTSARNALRRLASKVYRGGYLRFYGTADVHTHIRWRAIRPLLSSALPAGTALVLDVGCGVGSLSFEIARRYTASSVLGVDVDPRNIEIANAVNEKIKCRNLAFRELSAIGLADISDSYCDAALLIDVVEHVIDHRSVAREVGRVLKPGGAVIISVPTPNYPRVFGREFHNQIGHVRDGYWMPEIKELFAEAGIRIEEYKYYTHPASSLACFLYYRWLRKVFYATIPASPLLNLISYLDYLWPIRGPKYACAIALRGRKDVAQ
jgi:SAM-dependent methyltransferase